MSSDIHFEVLTVDEFAERMKVCRTTIFQWMKDSILIQGEHFFKHKRVLLFLWCKEIIISFIKRCSPEEDNTETAIIHKSNKVQNIKGSMVNWELN